MSVLSFLLLISLSACPVCQSGCMSVRAYSVYKENKPSVLGPADTHNISNTVGTLPFQLLSSFDVEDTHVHTHRRASHVFSPSFAHMKLYLCPYFIHMWSQHHWLSSAPQGLGEFAQISYKTLCSLTESFVADLKEQPVVSTLLQFTASLIHFLKHSSNTQAHTKGQINFHCSCDGNISSFQMCISITLEQLAGTIQSSSLAGDTSCLLFLTPLT